MKIARWIASFFIGAIVLVVSLYFVISLCVAFFKITGRIVEGQPMFFELRTPAWTGLLIFQAVCLAVLGICFFLRSKLRGRNEQSQ